MISAHHLITLRHMDDDDLECELNRLYEDFEIDRRDAKEAMVSYEDFIQAPHAEKTLEKIDLICKELDRRKGGA